MREIKYWIQAFFLPIYWISFLMPRNKEVWVFGSTFGKRFADNPRYFYLYVSQFEKEYIRPVWISRDKKIVSLLNEMGYLAYYNKSFKGIWTCLRARVYLYDNYSKDISFLLSGRAIKINMWHGIPLKKINNDNKFDQVRNPQNSYYKIKWGLRRMSDEKPTHYVLTTAEHLRDIFFSAFQTRNIIISGYPRNDVIQFNNINNIYTKVESEIIKDIIENCGYNSELKKMIIYMPTFRNTETLFLDIMDLKKFDDFLENEKIIFYIKLHPKSKLKHIFSNICYKNIINIDADIDPYSIINYSSLLITDYSSVYFDYLLTNKPIIFFNYDIEQYLNDTREMYFEYNKVTPGIKAKNMVELQEAIKVTLNSDQYSEERFNIKNTFFDQNNYSASEKLVKIIKSLL